MRSPRVFWQGMRRFIRLPAQDRADVGRALIALAQARRQLHRVPPNELTGMEDRSPPEPSQSDAVVAARVAVAIQRAAQVAPWRSDCLVQAMAARSWLDNQGVPTHLRLGARRTDPTSQPIMHAWLLCGPMVVTGGDIAQFHPFNPTSDRPS